MKRLLPVLLLALLLLSSWQNCARAAVTPPEKTASGTPGENPNNAAIFNPLLTIQLQRDAEVWGEGTVLDVEVGPNLYAYVRQNPWTAFDPEGLRKKRISKRKVEAATTGHHKIPFETWDKIGGSKAVHSAFNDARIATDNHGWSRAHASYNKIVGEYGPDFAKSYKSASGKAVSGIRSEKEARAFTKALVEHVESKSAFAKQFNQAWDDFGTSTKRAANGVGNLKKSDMTVRVNSLVDNAAANGGLATRHMSPGTLTKFKLLQAGRLVKGGIKGAGKRIPVISGLFAGAAAKSAPAGEKSKAALMSLTGGDIAEGALNSLTSGATHNIQGAAGNSAGYNSSTDVGYSDSFWMNGLSPVGGR